MVCSNCGRITQNEEANFCEYCGSTFREHIQVAASPVLTRPAPQIIQENSGKPVTFLNWLGTYGVLFIPGVGVIAFLAMLLIWAFGKNVTDSKKNWARATLIFVVVSFIYLIIFMVIFMRDPLFQDFINGNIDMNEFLSSYYNM